MRKIVVPSHYPLEHEMQGKQAKILSPTQERVILHHLEMTRYPWRDRVMFLLSLKAGCAPKKSPRSPGVW